MKNVISFVLVLALLFCCPLTAMAAVVSPAVDRTEISAGDSIVVTLSVGEEIDSIFLCGINVIFDSDLFTYTSGECINPDFEIVTTNGDECITLSFINTGSGNHTGNVASLTFTANSDITGNAQGVFSVQVDSESPDITGGDISVNIQAASNSSSGYTVSLSPAAKTVTAGSTAYVDVLVSADGHEKYNAFDMTLEYTGALVFDSSVSTVPEGAEIQTDTGTIRISMFGKDRQFSDLIRLGFTVNDSGSVTIVSANIDEAANSHLQNAPAASIGVSTANITAEVYYAVTLPTDFEGNASVKRGEDYTFKAKNLYYDYSITAVMGDKPVTIEKATDGSYVIPNATGKIVIESEKTPKSYSVTVDGTGKGDVVANASATYNLDYTFRVNKAEGYDYTTPVVYIGDVLLGNIQVTNDVYTIPGGKITGNICITVDKEKSHPDSLPVTVEGITSGFTGDSSVAYDTDYTFALTKAAGYEYTLSATMGGEAVNLVDNGDGTYTVKSVTDIVVIKIERVGLKTVEVNKYLKLDGTVIYRVFVKGTLEDGEIFMYGDNAMFYSDKYNGYVWLLKSDKSLNDVKSEADDAVNTAKHTKPTIEYNHDINQTSVVDINDAQMVYNMYNAHYENFDTVPMLSFLRADVNGDGIVNVTDAVAVVYGLNA